MMSGILHNHAKYCFPGLIIRGTPYLTMRSNSFFHSVMSEISPHHEILVRRISQSSAESGCKSVPFSKSGSTKLFKGKFGTK